MKTIALFCFAALVACSSSDAHPPVLLDCTDPACNGKVSPDAGAKSDSGSGADAGSVTDSGAGLTDGSSTPDAAKPDGG